MKRIPKYRSVNLLADPQETTAQLLQFVVSLERLPFLYTSDHDFLTSVLKLSLIFSLYFPVYFQVSVEFLSRSLYEFLAQNPIFNLRYDTAKSAKEILIVFETAAVVMMRAKAEYRRNFLTCLVRGPLSGDINCWCNL